MSKNKMTIDFKGFAEYAAKLEELGGDLKAASEEALQNTHNYITPNLHRDMKRHRLTGETEGSITDDAKVEWQGNKASLDVGFSIRNGGLPSIFLMYGTPRMQKDQKLYNDVYGTKTRKDIKELQEKTFDQTIWKVMEG